MSAGQWFAIRIHSLFSLGTMIKAIPLDEGIGLTKKSKIGVCMKYIYKLVF